MVHFAGEEEKINKITKPWILDTGMLLLCVRTRMSSDYHVTLSRFCLSRKIYRFIYSTSQLRVNGQKANEKEIASEWIIAIKDRADVLIKKKNQIYAHSVAPTVAKRILNSAQNCLKIKFLFCANFMFTFCNL